MNLMFRKNFRDGAKSNSGGGIKLTTKTNRNQGKRSRDIGNIDSDVHYRTHIFFSPSRSGNPNDCEGWSIFYILPFFCFSNEIQNEKKICYILVYFHCCWLFFNVYIWVLFCFAVYYTTSPCIAFFRFIFALCWPMRIVLSAFASFLCYICYNHIWNAFLFTFFIIIVRVNVFDETEKKKKAISLLLSLLLPLPLSAYCLHLYFIYLYSMRRSKWKAHITINNRVMESY